MNDQPEMAESAAVLSTEGMVARVDLNEVPGEVPGVRRDFGYLLSWQYHGIWMILIDLGC